MDRKVRVGLIALATGGLAGIVALTACRVLGPRSGPAAPTARPAASGPASRPPPATATPAASPLPSSGRLETEAAAVERAFACLGIEREGVQVSAERVTLTPAADQSRFLRQRLIGRPVWCVKVANVRLHWQKGDQARENPHIRNLYVFFDPDDGQLLKVSSRAPPAPSAAAATEEGIGVGGYDYEGFPDHPPRVGFLQALASCHFAPSQAREIVAHYVASSAPLFTGRPKDSPPNAVWVIYLRGFPPIPLPAPPGAKTPYLKESLDRVDAATGKWISGGSCIWPE